MVEPIKLTDAARYYSLAPHQTMAWEWLQEAIDEKTLAQFAVKYRHPPELVQEPQQQGYITPELLSLIHI